MCYAYNEKQGKVKSGRSRTFKSGKHQNAWSEEKFQVLGNIGSKHHQTNRNEWKNKKGVAQKKKKLPETKPISRNLIKGINTWAIYHSIYLVFSTHAHTRTYTRIYLRRCPWCNGYRRRKWTRRHEFKSWIWLISFHIALIPLGKVWIQLFSLQLWVNSRTD